MRQRIEVRRSNDDALSVKKYFSWYDENRHALYLDGYYEMSRPTVRHKPRTDRQYQRTLARNNDFKVEQIELPESVVEEAKAQFLTYMKCVEVRRWEER